MPDPSLASSSLRAFAWDSWLPAGTLLVSQTLPPIVEPRPTVMRPSTVAPEQLAGAGALCAGADVWALGAILYECLSARPAFEGDDERAVLAKILLHEQPSLAKVRGGLPVPLVQLCHAPTMPVTTSVMRASRHASAAAIRPASL